MRYAVGSFQLESNTFSPLKANRTYFERNGHLLFGEDVIPYHRNKKNELAGFIDSANQHHVGITPLCAAWAVPYGSLERPFYEEMKNEFITRYKSEKDIDGLYLSLHGSMGVDGIDDPEGDLIESMRFTRPEVPITVTLDFHANVTERMVKNADVLVGYNSFPHTNLYETGMKAADASFQRYDHLKKLNKIFLKMPIITPLERMTVVGDEPMARLVKRIEEMEKTEGVIAVSLFCVQAWLDIAHMGDSIIGVAEEAATDYCVKKINEIADQFWRDRETYLDFKFYTPESAIAEALQSDEKPVVLNEPSDNVGAGATGDSTFVLRALLESQADVPSLLTIVDPEVVKEAIALGVGNQGVFHVGGKINRKNDRPVEIHAKVRTIFDGKYAYTGNVYQGVETSMGRTCVLQIKQHIFLQVTELPVFTIDPEHYYCVGLFPERMKLVLIKSQGSYKAAYGKIAKKVLYIDTPGLARSNLLEVPFRRIDKHLLFPFNKKVIFSPNPTVMSNKRQ
jgi:microcystin degradation protein MlrC